MNRRQILLGAFAALSSATVAGCSDADTASRATLAGPRPINDDEANRLAVARFNNFDRGVVPVSITYVDAERSVKFVGRVDYSRNEGLVDLIEQGAATGSVAWNLGAVALRNGRAATDQKALPATGWQSRALDPAKSMADAAFLIVLNLGFDRPDNPLLLQRNGATWEGSTTIGSHPVDRMTGPIPAGASKSNLTYFVDKEGLLVRVQAKINEAAATTVVEFADGSAPDLPDLSKILPAAPKSAPSESGGTASP